MPRGILCLQGWKDRCCTILIDGCKMEWCQDAFIEIFTIFFVYGLCHVFYKLWPHINEEVIELIANFYRVIYFFSVRYDWFQSMSFLLSFAQYFIYCVPRFPDVRSFVVKFMFVVRHFCFPYCFFNLLLKAFSLFLRTRYLSLVLTVQLNSLYSSSRCLIDLRIPCVIHLFPFVLIFIKFYHSVW